MIRERKAITIKCYCIFSHNKENYHIKGVKAHFGNTYAKIGMIQRILSWSLCKNDSKILEAFRIFIKELKRINIINGELIQPQTKKYIQSNLKHGRKTWIAPSSKKTDGSYGAMK